MHQLDHDGRTAPARKRRLTIVSTIFETKRIGENRDSEKPSEISYTRLPEGRFFSFILLRASLHRQAVVKLVDLTVKT